ncbi:gliding motility-associated C-terminal domain-containing protein [Flavobacterium sp. I-STPA6A]|uniref:gliding motility-associated C-terminal domain-containing protein n=2 Tax=unclassified Flavobacterium TaxID=196869 RepID=UPI00131C231B|nr:gliding motility-associated C-terminal domain-containing protein [Flavobacterium sp. I-STPA6A]
MKTNLLISTKITLLVMFFLLPIMEFTGFDAFAQTVTGVPSNTGCPTSGIVTASSTGLGATPQYQLLKSGVVVAPVSGNATQFANTNVFTDLLSGSYTVKGRATSGGTVYTSSAITVTDGYTAMAVTTPSKVASCIGGTSVLTSTISGGKAPFIYKIATQAAPSTYLETSTSISSANYSFAAKAAGSYQVSITDACGQTVTGAASITDPTISIADIKIGSSIFIDRTAAGNCTTPIIARNELGFTYVSNNQSISAADASLFTYKIKFQGQLYGQDTNADDYSDIGGTGFSPLARISRMPLIATRDLINTEFGNMFIVLSDACGNTKEFPIRDYNTTNSFITASNCNGAGYGKIFHGYGMYCLPINLTFTNAANPADVVTVTQTSSQQTFSGLTTGATYNFTYIDAAGYTAGLYKSSTVVVPAASGFGVTQSTFGTQENLNYLNYGKAILSFATFQNGDTFTYTVTTSSNPLVTVGYSNNATINAQGNVELPRVNPSDPLGYWPKGTYTLAITTACGTTNVTVTVKGYTASLSGNTVTPVCGGFNYVMNGTFDVQSAYQVIIVSGPASVGQTRDLASTSASLPFNSLAYGTYVFGLRIKGGTTNVLTQTVTYSAANTIAVDTDSTGGYVCSAGATNGVLTIVATTNSPAPGNTLEYALSLDGGATYGAFQGGNTFSGLGSGTYFFKVKDGCNNIIVRSTQIGLAAAPTASADGKTTPVVFCNLPSGSIQLDVDILGADGYLWAGPGITAANQNLKNPVIDYSALSVGTNTITCTITLGAPCNTTTVSNLIINVNPLPNVVITNPAAVCYDNKVDLTAAGVTTGSDAGLTYTYFTDAAGTTTLANPTTVGVSGTYYIKGTKTTTGCEKIMPVTVTVNPLPIATITYPNGPYCTRGTATVTQTGITGGTYTSDAGVSINASTGAINLLLSTAGSHTVTYSFTNGTCANTTTAIITIKATTLPTALADITAQCSATPIAPTLTDTCAGLLTATTTTAFPITTQGTTVVKWTFTYGGGYTQNVNQNVIIDDTVAPVAPTLTDVTGNQCSVASLTVPTATDACVGSITGTTTTVFPITTQGTTEITWSFDDNNGNISTATQNVIIDDTVAPVVPTLADITGSCSVTPTAPTTTDVCAGTITGTTTTVFPITAVGKTVVTWAFNDGNGNSITANQNVIITNTTKVGTETTSCALDGSGYTLTIVVSGQSPFTATGTGAPGTWSGTTWTSSKITKGTNYNVSIQDVNACNTLVVSGTAPVCCVFEVTCPTFPSTTIACYAAMPTATTLTEAQFEALGNADGVIGNIPCGVIEIKASNATSPACEGSVIRTYTVTEYSDANSNGIRDLGENTVLNTQNCTQTFTIDHTIKPVVPADGASTVECLASATVPTAPSTVVDVCGTSLTGVLASTVDSPATLTCEGTRTYNYTFTDCSGLVSNWKYVYTIDHTIKPVVPADGASTVECLASATTPTAPSTVVDVCGTSLTGVLASTVDSPATLTCEGTRTYNYTFTDCSGLVSNWKYVYTIDHTIKPVVPADGASTVECLTSATAPTAPSTVVDVCGTNITGVLVSTVDSPATLTCEGTRTYNYTFTDCSGLVSNWKYVYTIDHTIKPVVPADGASTVECLASATAPTAPSTVVDVCGTSITGVLASTVDSPATLTCEGTRTYNYTFTDCSGLVSNWKYVYTIDHTIKPVVPANGASTVECLASATAPTAPSTVVDVCGTSITGVLVSTVDSPATLTCEGTRTYNYTFTDCSGLVSNWKYVYTIDHTIKPVVPANGASTVECLASATAPTAPSTVVDVCGTSLTGVLVSTVDSPAVLINNGTRTYNYTFTDCSGLVSNWKYTYTISDTTAPATPTIANVTGQCTATATAPTTTDNCAGTITGTTSDALTYSTQGTHIIHWTFDDGNGNKTLVNQNVIIKDITAPATPTIADVTGQCTATATAPTTTDNCAGTITGTTSDALTYSTQGTHIIHWTFDDGNGNKTLVNQNVIVLNTIIVPISGGNQTQCITSPAQTLKATATASAGTTIVWYDSSTGGKVVSSPWLNTVGTITYYAESIDSKTGCSSLTRTPVVLTLYNCSISIIKTAEFIDENKDGYAQAGETIKFSFEVTNTGDVALTNVTVTDTDLAGLILTGSPIAVLAAGTSNGTAYSATYAITQADIIKGSISNQAKVTATTPLNTIVTDLSDDSNNLEDKPTVLGISGCAIEVFNAVSPNGDGNNDVFYIRGLECYPDNTVEIYNRWGVLVFERTGYNNADKAFKGISEGRVTVKQSEELPVGTYYYIFKYKDTDSNAHQKAGYLYLNR